MKENEEKEEINKDREGERDNEKKNKKEKSNGKKFVRRGELLLKMWVKIVLLSFIEAPFYVPSCSISTQ